MRTREVSEIVMSFVLMIMSKILTHLLLTTGHEKQNASSPKNRSNSIPAYVETNAVNKHPLPVTSPSSSARTAPLRNETGDGSLAPHERLNKLFERLERGDVERLQDISKAVKSFDR